MQSWRVIGVMFLALYAFGLLPGLFAWPAGVGDAIVGLSAPFVLRAIVRGEPTWRRRASSGSTWAASSTSPSRWEPALLTSPSSIGWFADAAPGACSARCR